MNLIIGATGTVGSEICRILKSEGKPVKAMVRETSDPKKIQNLKELGIRVEYGDLRNPSTIVPILKSVDTIISTVSSMPFSYIPNENDIQKVDTDGMINLIKNAKNAGVKHFIYTSFSKLIDLDFPLRNAKRKVENTLIKSGINYTILRPNFFMELWFNEAVGFDPINANVEIYGKGTEPISFVSFKDVAKFAVQCIDNPLAKNSTLEIGGPEKISQLDVVKIFEDEIEREINIRRIPIEKLKTQLETTSNPMEKSFNGLKLCLANGAPSEMKDVLKNFHVKMITVKEYAHRLVEHHHEEDYH
jgi:uncharacterized protein YbjT (DUF2867 family)